MAYKIELKDINFTYPGHISVFKEFNFKVKDCEKIGIKGLNGSGKSTLLKIITGLLKIQKGEIIIDDNNCVEESDFIEFRKKTGFLFQDPDNQIIAPSVEEDIAFGPLNLGVPLDEIGYRISEVCDELEIKDLLKRVPFQLSWGQKKLVALAGILVMQPEVILLDEPSSGISDEINNKIISYLKKMDKTFIIVSHEEHILNELCDRVINL